MVLVKTVRTSANVVPATPLITPWDIQNGIIYKVEVMFPPGPCGLVGVAIRTASHQLYPADSDEWFLGDNVTISFDDEYLFNLDSKQIEIATYNNDDFFTHMVQVRIGVITDPDFIRAKYSLSKIDSLLVQLQTLNSLLIMQNTASKKYTITEIQSP